MNYTLVNVGSAHQRASRLLGVFAALCAIVFSAGCGRTINRSAERRIRDVLPEYIGPARAWRAHVENAPERTLGGHLSSVTIDGDDVQMRQTIRLAELHIEMRDAEVDTGKARLKAVGATTFRAVISEAALNEYIHNFPPPEEEPVRVQRVALRPGHLYAESTRWLLGRAWPFTMTVEPRLASPTRLEFDPDRMSLLGLRVPLPASALRWLAKRLSDGFDFSTLPFPVRISTFRVESHQVVMEGTADVIQSLNERISYELRRGSACDVYD